MKSRSIIKKIIKVVFRDSKNLFDININVALVVLLIIVISASILRINKLDQIPPSLNWDEVAAAYNAYSVAHFGVDEWNKPFPLTFQSFNDFKHPVHIYTTALLLRFAPPTDFSARLPTAIIGILAIILAFFLARELFKNNLIAVFSSLFLALSPYHIHYSRGVWEIIHALFYFMLGIMLFLVGVRKKNWILILGFISFGVSLLTYHSAKVIVPLIIVLLVVLFWRELLEMKRMFLFSLLALSLFILLFIFDPNLLGLARAGQTKFDQSKIEDTYMYKQTKNSTLATIEIALGQYPKHFEYKYLFETGDQSPRNSVKTIGMFYKIELLFMLLGLIELIRRKSRASVILLVWILLSPLPSSLVMGAPNSTRALFMMGSLNILSALGAYSIVSLVKFKYLRWLAVTFIIIAMSWSLKPYLEAYYGEYAKKEAIEWQYGMKDIVEYLKTSPEYHKVYMTDVRSQPYIFFLYYLGISPKELHKTITYTEDESKSHNLVRSFDRYQFGGWDEIESRPEPGVMYIVEPSKYSGLRFTNDLFPVLVVEFPNGSPAFYMVTAL